MGIEDTFAEWKQTQSPETFRKLLDSTTDVQQKGLTTFGGGQMDPYMRTKARLLTADALKSFDPSRGAKLNTHIMNQLQRLSRFSARNQLINIPEEVRYGSNRLRDAEQELRGEFDRDPTDEELADRTGFSLRKIRKIRGYATSPMSESTYLEAAEGDTELPSTDAGADPLVDYMYFDLPTTDKQIFAWRTGYNGSKILSNQEIAKRLRITPGAVSQRINAIINRWHQLKGRSHGKR